MRRSGDNDSVAAAGVGVDGLIVVLLLGLVEDRGAVGVGLTAAGTATVELDALALAGDAVPLTCAGAAVRVGSAVAREGRAGRRGVGAVRERGAGGRHGRGAEVGDDIVDVSVAKAGAELVNLILVVVVGVQDVLGRVGRHGLGSLDLRNGQGAALGDVDGQRLARGLGRGLGGLAVLVLGRRVARRALAAGLVRRGRLGGLGRGLGGVGGDIEDVQLTAGGGLDGGLNAGVVGDVVAIDDVVVPVALAGFESRGLEAESSLPGAGLGRRLVLGEGKLALVPVPGAEKMNGLDTGGDAERE